MIKSVLSSDDMAGRVHADGLGVRGTVCATGVAVQKGGGVVTPKKAAAVPRPSLPRIQAASIATGTASASSASAKKSAPPKRESSRGVVTQRSGGSVNNGKVASRAKGKVFPQPEDPRVAAAVRIQAVYRGRLARILAYRQRIRLEQRREEDRQDAERRARQEAAAAAKREAAEAAKLADESKREQQLKSFRDRRCAIEQMCLGLRTTTMTWEEDPVRLTDMLEKGASFEDWLGKHPSKRTARRRYLDLARRWHPDKWNLQGETCVAVATDLTKCLVKAYEEANRVLPQESGFVTCEDEDEEREVCEFASWVGISFPGMFEVWKERKGVTSGTR